MSSTNDYLTSLFSLSDKTALITGATRGIGANMALALARAGADMILVQRSTENKETYDQIKALGRKVDIVVCDLANKEQVGGLIKKVVEQGHTLDIVVNCKSIVRLLGIKSSADIHSHHNATFRRRDPTTYPGRKLSRRRLDRGAPSQPLDGVYDLERRRQAHARITWRSIWRARDGARSGGEEPEGEGKYHQRGQSGQLSRSARSSCPRSLFTCLLTSLTSQAD